jgi:hypothetical protein
VEATARFVLSEAEEIVGPFDGENITELHDRVIASVHSGIVAGLLTSMFLNTEANASKVLAKIHENMGGDSVPYTLFVEGTEEPGVVDISGPALGEHHMRTLTERPELQEMVMSHVVDDCGNPTCPVLSFFETLQLVDRFRAPDHPGA